MKKLYFSLLVILFSAPVNAQFLIDFETPPVYMSIDSIQPPWQIGTPSKTLFNQAYSVPNVIITDTLNTYDTSGYAFFELVIPTPFGPDGYSLSFYHQYDFEDGKDGGWIAVYNYCNDNWVNITDVQPWDYCYSGIYGPQATMSMYTPIDTLENGTAAFTGSSSGWIWSSIQFYCMAILQNPNEERGGWAFNDTTRMRFYFSSDTNETNQEGWMIDNILLDVGTGICSSIEEYAHLEKISVSPNPATDRVVLKTTAGDLFQKAEICILNLQGQVVQQIENSNGSSVQLDLSGLSSGMYFYSVRENGVLTSSGKLIVE